MRSPKILASAVLLTILVLVAAPWVAAQSATGEVNGTITDPSNAVVVGATVRLLNQATGVAKQVTTNSTGYYIFIEVQPGQYSLHVEHSGFRTIEVPNLQVGVSQTLAQNRCASVVVTLMSHPLQVRQVLRRQIAK